MNRKLLSCTAFIFLSAAFTIEAQDARLRAVELERVVYMSDNPFDVNDALIEKAECLMSLGRYEDAFSTLDRVEMYLLDESLQPEVMRRKAYSAYLSGNYDASIAVLSEMGVGIGEVKAKLLNPLATMLLTLAVPAGYIYVGAPWEGVISTALNAASIAWTVTQIASGCYVSGILGGAIMLSSTYLGAQQRTSQICEEKNRKALDDAKRSLLSEYFSDFD